MRVGDLPPVKEFGSQCAPVLLAIKEPAMKIAVIQNTTKSQRELAGEMCERVKELVYEYGDLVPLALVIGVLEIAKQDLIKEHE